MAGRGVPALIEVRVTRVEQLFESLDPSPFVQRDLDPRAAEFILGWARDLPPEAPLTIRVHLSAPPGPAQAQEVAGAVAGYFGLRAEAVQRDRRDLYQQGRREMAVGLSILALCVTGGQVAMALADGHAAAQVLREALIIFGWVANWKPLQTFLYDGWPLRRRLRLLRRLAAAQVVLDPAAPVTPVAPPSSS